MATEQQLAAIIARCLSTVARYHHSGRAREKSERMVAEIQLIAGFVVELNLGETEIEETIIRPVETSLIAHYGHEVGPRHINELIKAFEGIKEFQNSNYQITPTSA